MIKSTAIFNKKADISGRKMVFYFIVIFVLVAAFFIVIWVIPSGKSDISEMPIGLEDYLLVQRFLNSPYCFTLYHSDIKRSYPHIFDLAKFTEGSLNKCYDAKDTNVKAYRLTLSYDNEKKPVNTMNWEGFLKKGETNHIFFDKDGKIQQAELFIETQNAK